MSLQRERERESGESTEWRCIGAPRLGRKGKEKGGRSQLPGDRPEARRERLERTRSLPQQERRPFTRRQAREEAAAPRVWLTIVEVESKQQRFYRCEIFAQAAQRDIFQPPKLRVPEGRFPPDHIAELRRAVAEG